MEATATANTNIALIKYWGKRNSKLNLPAVGSISVTLKELNTTTNVRFLPNLKSDLLFLNGKNADHKQVERVSRFLDLIREASKIKSKAEVTSQNNFPTGAGLASSASGFAALSLAASKAADLNLSDRELSILARRGSGSAARSIFGGYVEMNVGEKEDGSDSYATQLEDENYWPLNLLIVITSEQEKEISSTKGMNLTTETSPFYSAWIESSKKDLIDMRKIIKEKNFDQIGKLAEYNCLKMHGLALSANPGIMYWNGTTVDVIHKVRELRKNKIPAYFTIDAGPQVKVICEPNQTKTIKTELEKINGIKKIFVTSLGSGAKLSGRKNFEYSN
jgi:diphosphomevalonate decarboxylase